MTTDPGRVTGAKPAAFWRWLFDLVAAAPHDTFVDLYPASGGGARAWAAYTGVAPASPATVAALDTPTDATA